GPDDLDDLVDVENRDEQALDQVQPLFSPSKSVSAAACDDLQPMADIDAQHLLETERPRLPLDEGDVVDAERVLQRREPVQLLEYRVRVEARLDADLHTQSVLTVGEIVH